MHFQKESSLIVLSLFKHLRIKKKTLFPALFASSLIIWCDNVSVTFLFEYKGIKYQNYQKCQLRRVWFGLLQERILWVRTTLGKLLVSHFMRFEPYPIFISVCPVHFPHLMEHCYHRIAKENVKTNPRSGDSLI